MSSYFFQKASSGKGQFKEEKQQQIVFLEEEHKIPL